MRDAAAARRLRRIALMKLNPLCVVRIPCNGESDWPSVCNGRRLPLALSSLMPYLAAMNDLITQHATTLGHLLAGRGATVTSAESCTGGGIAEAITRVPGSSAWFGCGFITYSNQSKSALLAVPPVLIEQHGAVSETVVSAMVQGAMQQARADYGVAVSGIAGPTGGRPDKPVGSVWLAWAGPNAKFARLFQFDGDRAEVRQRATIEALVGLIECVESTV